MTWIIMLLPHCLDKQGLGSTMVAGQLFFRSQICLSKFIALGGKETDLMLRKARQEY